MQPWFFGLISIVMLPYWGGQEVCLLSQPKLSGNKVHPTFGAVRSSSFLSRVTWQMLMPNLVTGDDATCCNILLGMLANGGQWSKPEAALIPNETQFPCRTLVARLPVTCCKLLPGTPKKVEVM